MMRGITDRRGVAAVEFALVAPVMIVVALSLYDVTNAVITWWQLSAAAAAIARIATTDAATTSNTNSLSTDQAATASTAIFAVVASLATAPASRYSVTISSVVMTPTVSGCTADCTYVGNTAWSVGPQGSGATRACGPLGSVSNSAPSSFTTLPIDAFTASPVLVVDVTYDFIPLFVKPLFQTVWPASALFMQTAYMATRTGTNADWVRLTGPNAAKSQCPEYKT